MGDISALRLLAATGEPSAQVKLALALLTGQSAAAAIEEAARLIAAASAQNNGDALLLHAALAANGIGRGRSAEDAYSHVRRAAALGDARAAAQLGVLGEAAFDHDAWLGPIHLTQLAEAPRIFAVESFIPQSACVWLRAQAKDRLEPATVVDPSTGGTTRDPVRTNSAMAFSLVEPDLIVQLVCRRIAAAVGLPAANQEPTHVLHYDPGEQYRPHYDFIRPWGEEAEKCAEEVAAFGQRAATVLIYLNEDYEGGETEFGRLGLRFKGKTGDALIFWNVSETGELERNSLHAGLPVTRGEKWLLSKWIRQKTYPLL